MDQRAPEGEPGVYDPVLNPDCTWIHKISDSSLLEEKTYTVAKGATEMAVAATYTITAAEDPDCSVTCKHQLKVFADKPNCCPMKTNPGQHPPACDYGKGYWFTWPATSINPATAGTPNAGEPPVAENCTYTTVLDPDTVEEPTQLYFTAVDGGGNDFTATRAYIATNDQGEPCGARRFHDSIKIKDCSEDSPELGECCPIDAELGSQGTKGSDKNGEGFEFAFPADPGGWAQGDGTDERCTYDVVIDDPEKLKPTKYYVPEGPGQV